MRVLAIIILMILMLLLKYMMGAVGADSMPRVILAFGFLILCGYVVGHYAAIVGLPKITGYLIAGMMCGPFVLSIIGHSTILELKLIDDLALALIAFTAGGELKISRIKKCAASIFSSSVFQVILIFVIVGGGFYLLLNFLDPYGVPRRAWPIISILTGAVATACSPATAIAVIVDSRSKGRITDITIGATVIRDVFVILVFTIALAIGFSLARKGDLESGIVWHELLMILISVGSGLVAGVLIAFLLKYIRQEVVLFVVTVALVIVFISNRLELHFILVCLMAGFVVENFSSFGDRLVGGIERTSMTVFIIFFALAGAAIDFTALSEMWPYALAIVIFRIVGTIAGTFAGGSIGREGHLYRRQGWLGFISQAGMSLGLVTLVARAFPDWGATFKTIAVAAITINQIVGPITLKLLLSNAGETAEKHIVGIIRRPDESNPHPL